MPTTVGRWRKSRGNCSGRCEPSGRCADHCPRRNGSPFRYQGKNVAEGANLPSVWSSSSSIAHSSKRFGTSRVSLGDFRASFGSQRKGSGSHRMAVGSQRNSDGGARNTGEGPPPGPLPGQVDAELAPFVEPPHVTPQNKPVARSASPPHNPRRAKRSVCRQSTASQRLRRRLCSSR